VPIVIGSFWSTISAIGFNAIGLDKCHWNHTNKFIIILIH